MATEIADYGDRRSGIDRRQFNYDSHIPERRQRPGRRTGFDRRRGLDRRSGTDRRIHADRRIGKLREKDQRKSKVYRSVSKQ